MVETGLAARSVVISGAAARICSQLSRTRSSCWCKEAGKRLRQRLVDDSRAPRVVAMVDNEGRIGQRRRSTNTIPSGKTCTISERPRWLVASCRSHPLRSTSRIGHRRVAVVRRAASSASRPMRRVKGRHRASAGCPGRRSPPPDRAGAPRPTRPPASSSAPPVRPPACARFRAGAEPAPRSRSLMPRRLSPERSAELLLRKGGGDPRLPEQVPNDAALLTGVLCAGAPLRTIGPIRRGVA